MGGAGQRKQEAILKKEIEQVAIVDHVKMMRMRRMRVMIISCLTCNISFERCRLSSTLQTAQKYINIQVNPSSSLQIRLPKTSKLPQPFWESLQQSSRFCRCYQNLSMNRDTGMNNIQIIRSSGKLTSTIFSRVLRNSTPRYVGRPVRPSVTLYFFWVLRFLASLLLPK